MSQELLLKIRDLKVQFSTREGTVNALNGVDLDIYRGETLGVVGESGCGKSMTARSILGLIPKAGKIVGGNIELYLEDASISLTGERAKENVRKIRGKAVAMIFQEPMTSFSPIHTIGNQIGEAIQLHQGLDKNAARERVIELLSLVGIPDAKRRVDAYPFELSGGMRQRAMIAMALSCNPALLIADEPTTALDVTIQAQILELLRELQERLGMSIMLITHNIGVVAAISHRISVMYLGKVIEEGSVEDVLSRPKHPYTVDLLKSMPKLGHRQRERLWSIKGTLPDPYTKVVGCAFHPRCSSYMPGVCDVAAPAFAPVSPGHKVACFIYKDSQSCGEVE
jgi:peptide/nickel transport system ATP-binding protein